MYCLSLSVYESFKDYITVETLDGDNKYDAGEHGFQVLQVFTNVVTHFVNLSLSNDNTFPKINPKLIQNNNQ